MSGFGIAFCCSILTLSLPHSTTTLDNGQIRIVITPDLQGVRPGSLLEFTDLATGAELAGGLQFGGVQSDVFIPYSGEITVVSDTEAVFTSPYMYDHTETDILPISVSITYRLNNRGLEMIFEIKATSDAEINHPLEIDFTMKPWDTAFFHNQTIMSDRIIDFNVGSGGISISGDQSVTLDCNTDMIPLTAEVLFPNPSKSNLSVNAYGPSVDPYISLRLFDVEPPRENCMGPDLHSIIPEGDISRYYISFSLDENFVPVFISDHPNGLERSASWILDEIPMIHPSQGDLWGFSTTSSGPEPVSASLIRLLEDHPEMKMNWIILPDGIFGDNRDSVWIEPGFEDSWSHWHCTWRISDMAPAEFLQWLSNIENDVYPWADRINMGSHGYHHTPNYDSSFGQYHEFITFEPEEHMERFMMFASDIIDSGLDTSEVISTIRFPGHRTSLSGLWAIIAWGFDFYCNGVRWYDWNGGEIFHDMYISKFQTQLGRIWGTNTVWWADYSALYADSLLSIVMSRGKHGLLGGHPNNMMGGGIVPAAYERLDSICGSLENDYENFGWLFPIEYGDFLEECYGILWNKIEFSPGQTTVSFSGQVTLGQTAVLLLPDAAMVDQVLVDNQPVSWDLRSGNRLFVQFPVLAAGNHSLSAFWTFTGINSEEESPDAVELSLRIANPSIGHISVIAEGFESDCSCVLSIFDLSGRKIYEGNGKTDNEGILSENINLTTFAGSDIPAGIYVMSIRSGNKALSESFVYIHH